MTDRHRLRGDNQPLLAHSLPLALDDGQVEGEVDAHGGGNSTHHA